MSLDTVRTCRLKYVLSHLTRALTVERTTLDSRKRGVTRMWKRDREAKATAGDRSASSEMWTWTTNVCRTTEGTEWKRLVSNILQKAGSRRESIEGIKQWKMTTVKLEFEEQSKNGIIYPHLSTEVNVLLGICLTFCQRSEQQLRRNSQEDLRSGQWSYQGVTVTFQSDHLTVCPLKTSKHSGYDKA